MIDETPVVHDLVDAKSYVVDSDSNDNWASMAHLEKKAGISPLEAAAQSVFKMRNIGLVGSGDRRHEGGNYYDCR